MSVMQTNRETGGAGNDSRPWSDAVWLAGVDIRRTWGAYLASAGYVAMLGLFIAVSGTMNPGTYSFEVIMFSVGLILTTPFFAREYMSWSTDPIAERLTWLRVLPIGIPTIVWSRAIAILMALLLNPVAFFTPLWFGGRWTMDRGEFVWFAVAMTGVSLSGAGFTLAMEMSVGIRRWVLTNIVMIVVAIVAISVVGLATGFRVFEQLTRAASWNGPLVALICLVLGCVVFLGCVRLAKDGLRRRELPA